MILIEKVVSDYLNNTLDNPTYTQEPHNGETDYYLIEKVGSSVSNKIDGSMIVIESHASSRYEAAQMNLEVIEAMDNIITLDDITRCEKNSDYDYTDTSRKDYRYRALFELTHY